MCEDDVVARAVLVAATGRGRAGETEFEDHIGGYVGVIGVWYSYAMQQAIAISKSLADSYNLRQPEVCRERERFRVRVWTLRPRSMLLRATLGK